MKYFLNIFKNNLYYTILLTTISGISIFIISFVIKSGRKIFGEWALNLLVIVLLIGPIVKIYNKYIKKFLLNNINDENLIKLINKLSIYTIKILQYRRQLGILVFFLAAIHGISFLTINRNNFTYFLQQNYIIAGIITLVLLFIGFITSNNFSQKLLKKYWKTIQTFSAYGALLAISFHLNFIEFGEGIGYLVLFITLIIIRKYF